MTNTKPPELISGKRSGTAYRNKRKAKREAFWNGFWLTQSGTRITQIRHHEYPELWRLWLKHKDIREGRYAPTTAQAQSSEETLAAPAPSSGLHWGMETQR